MHGGENVSDNAQKPKIKIMRILCVQLADATLDRILVSWTGGKAKAHFCLNSEYWTCSELNALSTVPLYLHRRPVYVSRFLGCIPRHSLFRWDGRGVRERRRSRERVQSVSKK